MRAYVESYGCTLNHGEADEIRDVLSSKGWELVGDRHEADLVVLATCIVIETTERRMVRRIKELSDAPRLIVTGCIASGLPEVARNASRRAELVPPGDVEEFSRTVETVGPAMERTEEEPRGYAIVPIATGCGGDCSYCITRLARHGLRSRPTESVAARISSLAETGPLEIRMTAQDCAAYGADIGIDLASLVRNILSLDRDFRLRVGMMNPGNALRLSERLVDIFGDGRVFKFAHLPVQSGSDRILSEMNRGYSTTDFVRIVERLRTDVPDLTLSTDIITGYPSETISDHEANLELVRATRPDIVNVTRFSPRPGTRAASAGSPVVGWKSKERSRELTRLRFEISLENNERKIGTGCTALATERGKGISTILRTDAYKQVVVRRRLPLREYHEVEITDATPTYLIGRLAG